MYAGFSGRQKILPDSEIPGRGAPLRRCPGKIWKLFENSKKNTQFGVHF